MSTLANAGTSVRAGVGQSALSVLRGVGQVMFQAHAGTGVLFLAGIAAASPLMLVGAILGAVTGTAVASVGHYDTSELAQGIYGFNPALVGIATLFYLQPRPLVWVLLVVGCVLSTVLTHVARRHVSFPTYTAPFIVVAWLVIVVAHAAAGTTIDVKPAALPDTPTGFLAAVLRGPAEVMFGATVLTGLLFLLGVAISNRKHAVLALVGSLLGTTLAIYHNNPAETISLGIYGYNASLAAIAVYLWRKSLLIPLLAAAISIPLTELFPSELGIPALTAPFVGAAWIVIMLGQLETVFLREPAP